MKKIFYSIVLFFILTLPTFAADWWILWSKTAEELRKWDITIDDIPNIIVYATNFLIWIAWTISVIFIIIWAYKYLFGSLEGNSDKGKDTIYMALVWFAISACAYLIIKFIFDNFAK